MHLLTLWFANSFHTINQHKNRVAVSKIIYPIPPKYFPSSDEVQVGLVPKPAKRLQKPTHLASAVSSLANLGWPCERCPGGVSVERKSRSLQQRRQRTREKSLLITGTRRTRKEREGIRDAGNQPRRRWPSAARWGMWDCPSDGDAPVVWGAAGVAVFRGFWVLGPTGVTKNKRLRRSGSRECW